MALSRSRHVLAAAFVTFGVSSSPKPLAADPLPAPRPVEKPPARVSFVADPVSDGAILSFASGTAILSEAILGTGEITPQQPQDPSKLLGIDRPVVDNTPSAPGAPSRASVCSRRLVSPRSTR